MITIVFALLPPSVHARASFERELVHADQLRSANGKRFMEILEALEARKLVATHSQRQHLQYLQAYRQAVYGEDMHEAVEQAKALFEVATDPELKFRTGSLISNLLLLERNFGEALRYIELTIPKRGEVRDKDIRHDGINTAAQLYNELGQYELGLHYAEETLADGSSPRAECFAGAFRMHALFELERLPTEDDAFHDLVRECQAAGEKIAVSTVQVLLARRYARAGFAAEAVTQLRAHIDEIDAAGYRRVIGEAHSLLAELLLQGGHEEDAQRHAQRAIAAESSVPTSRSMMVAHKVMYEIADRRGDPVAALASYRQYSEADRAYINELTAREMAYQVARQDSARKSEQIDTLSQRNDVLTLQREIERQKSQNTRLVASLLALLVGLVAFWAYKVRSLHASLRHLAETDALTGISNRHHFTSLSEATLAQCEDAGESAALLMFDLDHFKAINDTYGHVTGDWVLKQVALSCATFCRRVDHLARVGGEEFAILLSGCDLKSASRLAEDCRVRLSRLDTRGSGHRFVITASFGVSATTTSGYRLSALMSHADLMLYRAKREGRNRVRMYVPDLTFVPHAESPLLPDAGLASPPSRVTGLS